MGDFILSCPSLSSARVEDKGTHRVQPETCSIPLTRLWLFLILTFLFDRAKDSTVIQDSRRSAPHIVLRSYNPPLEEKGVFLRRREYNAQFKKWQGAKN